MKNKIIYLIVSIFVLLAAVISCQYTNSDTVPVPSQIKGTWITPELDKKFTIDLANDSIISYCVGDATSCDEVFSGEVFAYKFIDQYNYDIAFKVISVADSDAWGMDEDAYGLLRFEHTSDDSVIISIGSDGTSDTSSKSFSSLFNAWDTLSSEDYFKDYSSKYIRQ